MMTVNGARHFAQTASLFDNVANIHAAMLRPPARRVNRKMWHDPTF
jgi:uncharacterized membrane-anchored protein YhcB (DUF1043 family)